MPVDSNIVRDAHQQSAPTRGHERPLASMIRNQDDVRLDFLDGSIAFGIVTHFDAITITVDIDGSESPTIVFKHSLKLFRRYQEYHDEPLRYKGEPVRELPEALQ